MDLDSASRLPGDAFAALVGRALVKTGASRGPFCPCETDLASHNAPIQSVPNQCSGEVC